MYGVCGIHTAVQALVFPDSFKFSALALHSSRNSLSLPFVAAVAVRQEILSFGPSHRCLLLPLLVPHLSNPVP